MSDISSVLLPPLDLLLKYADSLVTDIDPKTFSSKPSGADGNPVNMLHPAFVIGHLGTYPEKIFTLLDMDIDPVVAPDGFKELFVKGSECKHDPSCEIYPSKELLIENFATGYKHVQEMLRTIPDSKYHEVNPNEDSVTRFPTRGSFVSFLVSGHIGIHLGQISSWRRFMGYPAA